MPIKPKDPDVWQAEVEQRLARLCELSGSKFDHEIEKFEADLVTQEEAEKARDREVMQKRVARAKAAAVSVSNTRHWSRSSDSKSETEQSDPSLSFARLKLSQVKQHSVNVQSKWSHWNRMPVITRNDAILLTMNIEPDSYWSNCRNRPRYEEISRYADSHLANCSLSHHDAAKNTFRSADWRKWLDTVGIDAPKSWRPSGGDDPTETELIDPDFAEPETGNNSVGRRRRQQYIDAAIDMFPTMPRGQVTVLNFIREVRENDQTAYPDINIPDDQSILKSIREAAIDTEPSNPLKDPRYLRTIDAADK